MDVSWYWAIIRRRYLRVVAAGILLGGLFGLVMVAREPGGMAATSRVFGTMRNSDSIPVGSTGTLTSLQMKSYVKLIGTTSLAERLIATLDLDSTPAELASRMSGTIDRGETIMRVVVRARTKDEARAIAEALPQELVNEVEEVANKAADDEGPRVRFTIIDGPTVAPSRPLRKSGLTIMMGMFLGGATALALAAGLARLAANKSPQHLARATGVPVVAIVTDVEQSPPAATEARELIEHRIGTLHRLASNLRLLTEAQHRLVIVTGATHGCGTSAMAMGLAQALSERGERVLLVDSTSDQQEPRANELMEPTLAACLADPAHGGPSAAVVEGETVATVRVSSSAEEARQPGLRRSVASALEVLSGQFDSIIVDTDPVLLGADDITPWQLADAALLVVEPEACPMERITSSLTAIQALGVQRIGMVLNRVEGHSVKPDQVLCGLVVPGTDGRG